MCNLSLVGLPRDSMDKLTCAECKGYLRVGPIKTTLTGESVCGNCSTGSKFASAIFAKGLNDLLSVVNFPCRYEDYGCTEYLPFNDTSKHEEHCVFRSYCCPADFLACSWIGTAAQIPQHCRESHRDSIMSEPTMDIRLNESTEETRLYTLAQFGFLVKSKTCLEEDKVWIDLEYIGDKEAAKEIRYKLIFHDENANGTQTILRERNPSTISDQTVFNLNQFDWISLKPLVKVFKNPHKLLCTLSIYIPRKVVANITEKLSKIKCTGCHTYMSLPIFQCPDGHNICSNCTSYNNTCILCRKTNLQFQRNTELELIAASYQLKCRWPKCKEMFSESVLKLHEQRCSHKQYKCPMCRKYYKNKEEIINHFAEKHDSRPRHTSEVTFIQGTLKRYDFYVLVHGEVFDCALSRNDEDETNFIVKFYNSSSFYSNYDFTLEIKNQDSSLPNKMYNLSNCQPCDDYYSYNLTISKDDISQCGKEYEFIFKIAEKFSS